MYFFEISLIFKIKNYRLRPRNINWSLLCMLLVFVVFQTMLYLKSFFLYAFILWVDLKMSVRNSFNYIIIFWLLCHWFLLRPNFWVGFLLFVFKEVCNLNCKNWVYLIINLRLLFIQFFLHNMRFLLNNFHGVLNQLLKYFYQDNKFYHFVLHKVKELLCLFF